ncbi:glycoside hydrolase family 3 protein [Dactylosporangium aurantiacum]|uniref:Glycoside hydrolase family 3 protein n=1 Tax=Dactylosporangium aurantiacum TaxID=35754 RepID=A0A9Q9IF75_9ACTN|nr:glycoside hydrolase family 3 N-terminal domain-containing protein [Dactylosporangium aurantiacum]MDG6107534.1 glycoside hydrolase family 3 N-terminal domain-containing protein [Dactylosporangium aurantiacum]UWZ54321.1 glycoside hydrolase family 3 protein [Dactylosporangium aurantiacum]
MDASTGDDLVSMANAVLQPGFVGKEPPPWVRRRLAEGLGGVVLFARNVVDRDQVAELTAALRAERPDVIVAIDEEAGDVTRIDAHNGSPWPGSLALGAIDDVALTREVACHIGRDLASVGITFDYAPDADVNSDPNNPVIGSRAFGAEPERVARHTAAWITGLQEAGVAACAKHFPGHGNTSVDSHLDVPIIKAGRAELDATELVPFRAAIDAGVRAVMSAHLRVPALDPELPATLSRRIMTELLRDELGFQGLIVTDGIEMRAISDRFGLAHATVLALAAGADAICVGGDHADEDTANLLRDAVVAAVRSGELPESRLADAAARVARLAAWSAAASHVPVDPKAAALGLSAARRALRITAPDATFPLTGPAYVIEFQPELNFAIAPETPWGLIAPLAELVPDTLGIRLSSGEGLSDALESSLGRPLVLVVRDPHRYAWITDALRASLAVRPDAIVVEMGVPAAPRGDLHIATFGATAASGRAVAELLAGR